MASMQDEMMKQIATDLGIATLSPEEQEGLITKFGEIALKAATVSIMSKLSEANRTQFMKLADSGNAEAVKAFLDKEVPDHEALAGAAVAEEVRRFKEFETA